MTREQIEAIRARLAGVFGPHGDGLAAAPSLAADVSALLEEVERAHKALRMVDNAFTYGNREALPFAIDKVRALLR
jgi:hypothetical protein